MNVLTYTLSWRSLTPEKYEENRDVMPSFWPNKRAAFFVFLASVAEANKRSFPHWTGCPCSARRPDFTSRAVPHATTLQANTQVLNPRQRNQQFLLANEPWHLWVHMGFSGQFLVEWGRCTFAKAVDWKSAFKIEDWKVSFSGHQTNLSWALPH